MKQKTSSNVRSLVQQGGIFVSKSRLAKSIALSLVLGVSGFVSSQVQAGNYTAANDTVSINTGKGTSKATATGTQSVAVGGLATADEKYTIAVGHNAQAKSEGEVVVGRAAGSGGATHQDYSLILGTEAGQSADGTSNENQLNGRNLYMGYQAGNNSSGGRNTFIGSQNAGSGAVGDLNIGIGQASLLRAKGNENTAVGAYSGQDVTGHYNSAVGTDAGKFVTGSYNMSLGTESAYNVHGNSNLLIGRRAGTATKIVEGDGETYEVYDAEATPVTGDRNIIVGESAGVSLVGSDNIVMGTNAGIGMNANQSIAIGSETVANHDDVVALGNHIQTTAAHSVFLGDGAAYVSESNRTKGIATDYTNMMIDGSSYAIAGGSEVVGVMSVGSDTTTRRIQNVAPGLVGPDSTDAINGSQLYAVTKSMGENIHNLRQESRRGDAMNAALAALKPVAYNPAEPTQIMAGIGNYRGKSAVALGAAHYVNGRTMINGGVAFSGDSRIMANLGLTWRIGQGEVPEDIGADNDKIVLALNTRVDSLEKVVDKQNSIIQQQTAKMDVQQQRIEQQQVQIDKLLALLQTK